MRNLRKFLNLSGAFLIISYTHAATTSKQGDPQQCTLPQHPDNGNWTIYGTNTSSGKLVDSGTILNVQCDDQYALNSPSLILCDNGKWTSEIGKCLELCPPALNTSTTTVTCSTPGTCSKPFNGTIALFKCNSYYENAELNRNPIRVCLNGKWNQEFPVCTPACGIKPIKTYPLILDGRNVTKSDYPWQVAVYTGEGTKQNLICGGSLINQRVILTAAYCVTELNGKVLPSESFTVAVGKYYRKFNDSRDTQSQYSSVKHIFTPTQYKGANQNYLGDIAILVTENSFVLNNQVLPVCLDWDNKYERQLLKPSARGFATGWGYTQENRPSENLKELQVPLITQDDCIRHLPSDFHVYLTYDKLCAGYLEQGTSVCRGDGGGGLVVKNDDDRYYIAGIVSLSPQAPTGGCTQQYSLHTKVSVYVKDFILDKLNWA